MNSRLTCILLVTAWYAGGQDAGAHFEVDSVKVSPNSGLGGGRTYAIRSPDTPRARPGCSGTTDPGRWQCESVSMATLILSAFQLQRYQFQPAEWMNSTRFDIVAKVPAGATREQLSEMERNLLTTRFRMAAHYEAKDLPGYRLVVGKDGPRIKDSVDDPPSYTPPAPPKTMRWDAEGFPILPEGKETVLWILNGKVANRWRKITIPELANYFADQLNGPVVDATNLPGKYDIVLRFVSRPAPLPGTPLERGPDVKSSSRHWSQRLILKRPYNRNSA